jgi:carboxylesterase type B
MADPAVVQTDSGPVRGTVTDDYRLFQGIPYAASTAGELRWRSPQPVRPWTQVRDATRPGPMCPQQPSSYAEVASLAEDCLCLNVTVPRAAGPQQPRPVMVWIHGDGAIGAGSFFDARRLATVGDVLVVTINYRLGIFGAFGHPGLEDSGAFGEHADQVQASYPLSAYRSPNLAWATVLTDRMWARSTFQQHRLLARQVSVYAYEFADRQAPMYLPFPEDFPPGAFHAAEVPYLFPDQPFQAASTPDQRRLSDQMIRYWTNFAGTGDPNGAELPPWRPFDDARPVPHVQSLAPGADGITPVDYAAEHQLDFWSSLP